MTWLHWVLDASLIVLAYLIGRKRGFARGVRDGIFFVDDYYRAVVEVLREDEPTEPDTEEDGDA